MPFRESRADARRSIDAGTSGPGRPPTRARKIRPFAVSHSLFTRDLDSLLKEALTTRRFRDAKRGDVIDRFARILPRNSSASGEFFFFFFFFSREPKIDGACDGGDSEHIRQLVGHFGDATRIFEDHVASRGHR